MKRLDESKHVRFRLGLLANPVEIGFLDGDVPVVKMIYFSAISMHV
jgi:hypothetical protein